MTEQNINDGMIEEKDMDYNDYCEEDDEIVCDINYDLILNLFPDYEEDEEHVDNEDPNQIYQKEGNDFSCPIYNHDKKEIGCCEFYHAEQFVDDNGNPYDKAGLKALFKKHNIKYANSLADILIAETGKDEDGRVYRMFSPFSKAKYHYNLDMVSVYVIKEISVIPEYSDKLMYAIGAVLGAFFENFDEEDAGFVFIDEASVIDKKVIRAYYQAYYTEQYYSSLSQKTIDRIFRDEINESLHFFRFQDTDKKGILFLNLENKYEPSDVSFTNISNEDEDILANALFQLCKNDESFANYALNRLINLDICTHKMMPRIVEAIKETTQESLSDALLQIAITDDGISTFDFIDILNKKKPDNILAEQKCFRGVPDLFKPNEIKEEQDAGKISVIPIKYYLVIQKVTSEISIRPVQADKDAEFRTLLFSGDENVLEIFDTKEEAEDAVNKIKENSLFVVFHNIITDEYKIQVETKRSFPGHSLYSDPDTITVEFVSNDRYEAERKLRQLVRKQKKIQ